MQWHFAVTLPCLGVTSQCAWLGCRVNHSESNKRALALLGDHLVKLPQPKGCWVPLSDFTSISQLTVHHPLMALHGIRAKSTWYLLGASACVQCFISDPRAIMAPYWAVNQISGCLLLWAYRRALVVGADSPGALCRHWLHTQGSLPMPQQ